MRDIKVGNVIFGKDNLGIIAGPCVIENRDHSLEMSYAIKEVSEDVKRGFAKMIVSADEGDIHGLLDSFSSIGLKLRTDVSFDINLLVKYFFREAKPQEEAKKENKKRREEWKEKEEMKKKTVYEKDSVDVTKT